MTTEFSYQSIPAQAGIGLRAEHYKDAEASPGLVPWYEVHPENYFGLGGVPPLLFRENSTGSCCEFSWCGNVNRIG